MEIKCKKIVKGKALGKLLMIPNPINFLGMANTLTGDIITETDSRIRQNMKESILVFPNAIGSSVGAYTIFSLKHNNTSPNGIICTNKVDITTASGCAISNIPLAFIDESQLDKFNMYLIHFRVEKTQVLLRHRK